MIRRSLNPRFSSHVLNDIKTTTIRDKPWPILVPIMLFNWTGRPYRSKQTNVAAIIVDSVQTIDIDMPEFGEPYYTPRIIAGRPLWSSEGFKNQDDMDSWFYKVVKNGTASRKFLMSFHRIQ